MLNSGGGGNVQVIFPSRTTPSRVTGHSDRADFSWTVTAFIRRSSTPSESSSRIAANHANGIFGERRTRLSAQMNRFAELRGRRDKSWLLAEVERLWGQRPTYVTRSSLSS